MIATVTWTRLPDAPPGRTLGPSGPAQCVVRAEPGDRPGTAERCGGVLGHAPLTAGNTVLWTGTAVEGHEPWPEVGRLHENVGGHIWYCDRGPLSLCERCGLPYSRWAGDACPALGPLHGPALPTLADYLALWAARDPSWRPDE